METSERAWELADRVYGGTHKPKQLAELFDAALREAATAPSPCGVKGHLAGEWVETREPVDYSFDNDTPMHCRACEREWHATVAGMVQMREEAVRIADPGAYCSSTGHEYIMARRDAKEAIRALELPAPSQRELGRLLREKESFVAQHVRGGANDGCQCEPCQIVSRLLAEAEAKAYARCAEFMGDDPNIHRLQSGECGNADIAQNAAACAEQFQKWAEEAHAKGSDAICHPGA